MSQMVGAGAQVPCDGPEAASGQEAGAEAMGTRGGPGAVLSWKVGAGAVGTRGSPQPGGGSRCLDLMLVRGGTQSSGYRQKTCTKTQDCMAKKYDPSI
jgi:hypothetical protein